MRSGDDLHTAICDDCFPLIKELLKSSIHKMNLKSFDAVREAFAHGHDRIAVYLIQHDFATFDLRMNISDGKGQEKEYRSPINRFLAIVAEVGASLEAYALSIKFPDVSVTFLSELDMDLVVALPDSCYSHNVLEAKNSDLFRELLIAGHPLFAYWIESKHHFFYCASDSFKVKRLVHLDSYDDVAHAIVRLIHEPMPMMLYDERRRHLIYPYREKEAEQD